MTEITSIDMTPYQKRNDAVSAAIVCIHLIFAVLPVWLAAWTGVGWQLAVFYIWYGVGLNSVLNMMHECAHYHIFTNKAACDRLGRWVLSALVLSDFDGYRARHWMHHRQLGTDQDTKYVYLTPIGRMKFAVLVMNCLFLIEAFKRFGANFGASAAKPATPAAFWYHRALALHGLLFGMVYLIRGFRAGSFTVVTAVDSVVVYLVIVIYGMASVTVFMAALRAIAEHQIGKGDEEREGHAALRNFKSTPIGRWFFGAYGFAEHKTHHHFPAIPYYHLVDATNHLGERDASFRPSGSYLGTLSGFVRAKP